VAAVEVGLGGGQGVAEVEGGVFTRPSLASIFPLRFGRQAAHPPSRPLFFQCRELVAELLGVLPGDVLHRVVGAAAVPLGEARGVVAHDLLVLALGHLVDAQVERLRDFYLVLLLVVAAVLLVPG
jgi:hypothetical protein